MDLEANIKTIIDQAALEIAQHQAFDRTLRRAMRKYGLQWI